jgi:hypothetical protein
VLGRDPDLAEAIADFIDADGDPRPRGAEDAVYLRRQPAYRAANRALFHLSEIRLVQGVDGDTFDALRPHVCVLPQPALLNLNFASPQVWMSLDEAITDNLARQLWRDGQARVASSEAVRSELDQLGVPSKQPTTDAPCAELLAKLGLPTSPSNCMVAGTSTSLTIVASKAIATAHPSPISLIEATPVKTNVRTTSTMISAADEMVEALLLANRYSVPDDVQVEDV